MYTALSNNKHRIRLSRISLNHYGKLVFRSGLLVFALILYIISCLQGTSEIFDEYRQNRLLLAFITTVFTIEIILRMFPSRMESMGCQKQFARNYIPTVRGYERRLLLKDSWRATLPVALSWIALNSIIALLYLTGMIDWVIMVIIALFYSVCDMICILFFCPFQTWMMKNKCCGSCRIYNWDYAMMFTPLLLIAHPAAHWLVFLALMLLVRWEITFHLHPERFYERTNASLSCASCPEKLCQHKRQLRSFLKKHSELLLASMAPEDEA